MKAAPTSAFVMTEADFLFEFLVVALDAPAPFCLGDECGERHVGGQGGKPVFGRLGLAVGPSDEEPFFGPRLAACSVTVCRANAHSSEA